MHRFILFRRMIQKPRKDIILPRSSVQLLKKAGIRTTHRPLVPLLSEHFVLLDSLFDDWFEHFPSRLNLSTTFSEEGCYPSECMYDVSESSRSLLLRKEELTVG